MQSKTVASTQARFANFLSAVPLLQTAVLFAAYLFTAKLGLSLGAVSGFATLVWPPTGIALAALVLFGFRLWPGIALAALLVNYWTGAPFLVACGIALGNTLEPLVGAFLFLKVAGISPALDKRKDILWLVILVAPVSTLISATMGVSSLYLGKIVPAANFFATWRAWWIGDAISDLVIAPLLLVWCRPWSLRFKLSRIFEGSALGLFAIALSLVIFGPWTIPELRQYVFPYWIFPLLIWTTFRFGQQANTLVTIIISTVATWGTVHGYGPFQSGALFVQLLSLQIFVTAISVSGLFFGALGREKEEALRLRSDFVSIASHELKTPLTTLKLQMQLAKRAIEHDELRVNSEKIVQFLDSSDRQLDRVTKLVDDLLDISRIQNDCFQMNREKVDLSLILSEVIERFAEQMKIAGCRLETHLEVGLQGKYDRHQMEQAITNLLSNAMKYGKGKPIEISLRRDGESALLLTVKDRGMGVAKENQDRIFERFERAVPNQSITGLGLGLYISKQIVEAHRGKIEVESRVGEGSTFSMRLPIEVEG